MTGAKEDRAKVFWSGRSQAVRIPKAYRFDTDEVSIRRDGDAVVLEPVEPEDVRRNREWDEVFAARGEPFSDDMVEAIERYKFGPGSYERDDIDLD